MPGPVPGIHVFLRDDVRKYVDGRDKPGHDDLQVFLFFVIYH
jgi:hypothetical protein